MFIISPSQEAQINESTSSNGEHDGAGTIRRDIPRWAVYVPQPHYAVIPEVGHNANQDNARFFNDVRIGFLDRHVGEGKTGIQFDT